MPGRIFISYSKADPEPTRALADFLTAQGYTVWWDTNLTSGEVFREVIDRELAAADAVIVIWTAHSVASNWVVSEADDAARRGKLITVRTGDLEPWRIPKPYNTYQADPVDNRDAVLAAVRRVAGEAPKPEVKPSPSLSEATLHEALALEYWQAIKASADPAKLRHFLKEFGGTKCAPLARAEHEYLAEREWRKLVKSKNVRALTGFRLLFPGTPQAELAINRIAALARDPAPDKWPSSLAAVLDRYPTLVALLWIFTIVPGSRAGWSSKLSWPAWIAGHIDFTGFTVGDFNIDFGNFNIFIICPWVLGTCVVIISAFRLMKWRASLIRILEYFIYWFGISLSVGYLGYYLFLLFSDISNYYILDFAFLKLSLTGLAVGASMFVASGLIARRRWNALHLSAPIGAEDKR